MTPEQRAGHNARHNASRTRRTHQTRLDGRWVASANAVPDPDDYSHPQADVVVGP